MNVNIQEKLNEWLKNEKLRRGVVAAGIIAAALMVFTNLAVPNSGEGRETDFAVSEYCDKLIQMGMKGGFILGSGCEVPMNAKPENVAAMIASVR